MKVTIMTVQKMGERVEREGGREGEGRMEGERGKVVACHGNQLTSLQASTQSGLLLCSQHANTIEGKYSHRL